MKAKSFLVHIGLLVLTVPAFGQSAHESESRFGSSFRGYEIRSGIMLVVRQTKKGKPSQVAIQRFAGTGSANHFGSKLDPSEVKQIVDLIVPEKERGAGTNGRFPVGCAGFACEVICDYEFVSIHLVTSVNAYYPSDCHDGQPAIQADTNPNNPFPSAELILIDWKNP